MSYYYALIFLTLMSAIVLILIVNTNQNIEKKRKNGFTLIFGLIMLGELCEVVGTVTENIILESKLFWFYDTITLIEILIIPLIPFFNSKFIFRIEFKETIIDRIMTVGIFSYILIGIILTIINQKMLTINSQILFQKRTSQIVYLISILYMLFITLKFSKKFQNSNVLQLIAIFTFTIVGMINQLCNQEIKIKWFVTMISVVLFYIYYNNVIQSVDGLTGMLNRKCYANALQNLRDTCFTLIIFDINNFKYINDTYGHSNGDRTLCKVGKQIIRSYQKYGKCYRIGGDEFAVIIKEKYIENVDQINSEFVKRIIGKIKNRERFPMISYGVATYYPSNKEKRNIEDVIIEADNYMYAMKKGK